MSGTLDEAAEQLWATPNVPNRGPEIVKDRQAGMVGVTRRCSAISRQRQESRGTPPGDLWGVDIDATAAELAVACYLDRWWNALGNPADIDADCGDGIQVRHTRHDNGRLIVYREEDDHQRFVLVRGTAPRFDLVGWIWGHAAKEEAWWNPQARTPAYFVPEHSLSPMVELRH